MVLITFERRRVSIKCCLIVFNIIYVLEFLFNLLFVKRVLFSMGTTDCPLILGKVTNFRILILKEFEGRRVPTKCYLTVFNSIYVFEFLSDLLFLKRAVFLKRGLQIVR